MRIINFLLITLFCFQLTAQTKLTKKQVEELPNTVNNQFLKTYTKASNWHEYKMFKRADFLNLQKNILDSVSSLKKEIINHQTKIEEQGNSIASLNEKISNLNNNLNQAVDKENKISFLGASLTKGTYNTIVWTIILGLLASMVFFIYKFKNSNTVTKEAKKSLTEIEEEFNIHRKKSIEKEQKLRRQLQDEINKQRGI